MFITQQKGFNGTYEGTVLIGGGLHVTGAGGLQVDNFTACSGGLTVGGNNAATDASVASAITTERGTERQYTLDNYMANYTKFSRPPVNSADVAMLPTPHYGDFAIDIPNRRMAVYTSIGWLFWNCTTL